jgi:hypothetical protein
MDQPIGYRPPPESDLIDEILLAAGKALYLANEFEVKCKFVLTVAYAEEALKADPVIALQEELMREHLSAKVPRRKRLHGILRDLTTVPPGIREHESLALERARDARNYIAHEAARAIGGLEGKNVQHMLVALRKLHTEVINLANGDYIVSSWAHQIEEPDAPFWSSAENLEWVEHWVFGHIPSEWLDDDWMPDHRPPKTIREAVSYKPWYSRYP